MLLALLHRFDRPSANVRYLDFAGPYFAEGAVRHPPTTSQSPLRAGCMKHDEPSGSCESRYDERLRRLCGGSIRLCCDILLGSKKLPNVSEVSGVLGYSWVESRHRSLE